MNTDDTITDWIRETVDRGATGAEEIHKAVVDLPLEILERNGLFEQAAADVRKFQDRSLGAVYDVVRQINHRVTELASDLLGGPDVGRSGADET